MPIDVDDVCFNKASIIERALSRALEEFAADPRLESHTHMDAMILNLERACQAAIDLAMHLIAKYHLGMPQNSADAFRILNQADVITESTARTMIAMTGFRNIAIHEYQKLDPTVLRAIGEHRWHDVVSFCQELGLRITPHPPDEGA